MTITGTGFASSARVALGTTGQSNIDGTNVQVLNANTLTCDFDLRGAAVAFWDVVVNNDAAKWGTLEDGFQTVADRPPTAPATVTITPSGPGTKDNLLATATGGSDPDGDATTYSYQWCKSTDGGTTWGAWGNTNPGLSYTLTAKGEQWKTRVRTKSGSPLQFSGWTESTPVTVQDTAPSAPARVTLTPLAPGTNDEVGATPSGANDPDGDAITYGYQWCKSTDGGATWTTWSAWGGIGACLPASLTTKGEWWKVRARSKSGSPALSSGWVESSPVWIGDTAPTPPATVVISPASPLTRDNLLAMATGGGDPDGDATAYSYQWCKSTDGGATWGAWGNTSPNLSYTLTAKGEQWKARVRTKSGSPLLFSAWTESAPVTIGDTAPTAPTSVSLAPAAPGDNDNLVATASGATDVDGDPIYYGYQWCKSTDGGATWTTWSAWGGAGSTMVYSLTSPGEMWKARARSKSGSPELYSGWTVSAPVTIGGAALPAAVTATAAGTAQGAAVTLRLTSAATVQTVILNLAGRIVATLPEQTCGAGTTTLLWNGRSAQGTRVPDGTYLLRVTARGADGSQASTLATCSLRR